MPKITAVEISCDFFHWHDMQSLNDCMVFCGLATEVSRAYGRVIYRWKGVENTSPTVYCMLQKS